jgi:hypothetical protein
MKVPRRAQLAASPPTLSAPSEKRSFEMLAYTGGVVNDWLHPIVWDLAGMSAPCPMPILKQHDPNQIAALATRSEKTTLGLKLGGDMYRTKAATEVCELGDAGFPWQASIGVENLEVEFLEPGQTRELNGNTHTGPMVIVTKSLVKESSFVPLGADGQTRSSVLADGGTINMEVKMTDVKTEPGPDLVQLERKRVAALKAAFPKNPEFALKHAELGSSLLEAKAAYADVLQEQLDKRPADELPEIPARGEQGGGKSAKLEFDAKFASYLKLSGGNRGQAMTQCIKENIPLHRAMLAEVNGGRALDETQRKGA